MAREYQPDAITLDIFLPDIEGWRVLERLKNDLSTRHIPVCVVSTDEARERALDSGAIGFIAKPRVARRRRPRDRAPHQAFVSRPAKQGAAADVDGDAGARREIVERLGAADVPMLVAWSTATRRCAAARARSTAWWSDPRAADLEPQDVLDVLAEQPVSQLLPVVFYGATAAVDERWKTRWRAGALRAARGAHSPSGCSTSLLLPAPQRAGSMPLGEREFLETCTRRPDPRAARRC